MNINGMLSLRTAVIQQACLDYIKGTSDSKYESFSRREVKKFMLSPEFDLYSDDIDGKMLINELNRKIARGEKVKLNLFH